MQHVQLWAGYVVTLKLAEHHQHHYDGREVLINQNGPINPGQSHFSIFSLHCHHKLNPHTVRTALKYQQHINQPISTTNKR